jgi:hypothetical protein
MLTPYLLHQPQVLSERQTKAQMENGGCEGREEYLFSLSKMSPFTVLKYIVLRTKQH